MSSISPYANYEGDVVPVYDSCIVNLELYAPHTLNQAWIITIVTIPLMTAWRLLCQKYFKPFSIGYVSRQTHISESRVRDIIYNNNNNSKDKDSKKKNDNDKRADKDKDKDEEKDKMTEKVLESSYKYCEELWKCLTMSIITIYGVLALYDKRWVYNSEWLYIEYPQRFPREIELYYFLDWGYHGHRLIFQFFDSKRKDFWATMIHHWITIGLIIFSYCKGFTEIGAFVMLVHDNTDAMLSLAKMVKYTSTIKLLQDIFFAIFAISWIVSRDIIFAYKIVFPTYLYSYPMYRGCYHYWYWYWGFEGGLFGLWCLHLYWTVFLFKAIYRILVKGSQAHDPRSDHEKKALERKSQ